MILNVLRFSGCFVAAALAVASSTQAQALFTPEERSRILEYWSAPGRYTFSLLSDAPQKGSWRARETVDGSTWIWKVQRALRPGKLNPAGDPVSATPLQAAFDAWLDRRWNYDYSLAERDAELKNSHEAGRTPFLGLPPMPPGQPPRGIADIAGEPPVLASAVQPRFHQITYDDGMTLAYQDNMLLRRKYAYYRFPEGVSSSGQKVKDMPEGELKALFSEAGLSASDMNVMKSVSLLEGGFDSINTYDTGFVSAGFIQFAAMQAGAGSLGAVLLTMKESNREEFDQQFRRFGIEASENGQLVALCPATGVEFVGPDAALKIISDRRLASIFQRAGRLSRAYRIAQLQVARRLYYPGNDPIRFLRHGRAVELKVKDVFKSEAGLATLMDRKVNTGSLGPLNERVQNLADKAPGVTDLSVLEQDLVKEMRWRRDYLADDSLSQPKGTPVSVYQMRSSESSRGTARGSRSFAGGGARQAKRG